MMHRRGFPVPAVVSTHGRNPSHAITVPIGMGLEMVLRCVQVGVMRDMREEEAIYLDSTGNIEK